MHPVRFLPEHCAVSNAVLQMAWLLLFFLSQLHPKVLMHGFLVSRLLQMSGVGSSVGLVDGASVGGGVVGMLDGAMVTDGPVTIPRLQHSGPLVC